MSVWGIGQFFAFIGPAYPCLGDYPQPPHKPDKPLDQVAETKSRDIDSGASEEALITPMSCMPTSDDIADTCRLEASIANEDVGLYGVESTANLSAATYLAYVSATTRMDHDVAIQGHPKTGRYNQGHHTNSVLLGLAWSQTAAVRPQRGPFANVCRDFSGMACRLVFGSCFCGLSNRQC